MATLYVVATPIGNLGDISARAIETLKCAHVIAAEDTRHSKRLLERLEISTEMVAYHDHNEEEAARDLVAMLEAGKDVALISDAGTPLISDPGYRLVKAALAAGIRVVPIPGASALLSALAVSALPTDRFCFEGFLPSRSNARRTKFQSLRSEARTMVFFEAPHRIGDALRDLAMVLGEERELTIARELTKQFEQVWHGTATRAIEAVTRGEIPGKGEFVLVVAGAGAAAVDVDEARVMEILLEELSPSAAAGVASRLLGSSRKRLYDVALSMKKE